MEIFGLSINGQKIAFPSSNKYSANKVDLLTGPNGSGKTRALSILAEEFSGKVFSSQRRGQAPNDIRIYLKDNAPPSKIIAQTYSPFSRFPPSISDVARSSLTSVYAEGNRRGKYYTCLGLWRTRRPNINDVSKRALEESIFNLSESPECAALIARVMQNIGFEDKFVLIYKLERQIDRLILANRSGGAGAILNELDFLTPYGTFSPLRRELDRSDPIQLSELLAVAFNVLGDLQVGDRHYQAEFGSRSRKSTYDYAIIQALSLLRQLGMLRLVSCDLTSVNGYSFDVVQASSGQQQMICSIMELASSLENDTLVLIDEPELSLHPQWQQMYLDNLHAALEPFRGCHVLVATHSPLVVQRGLQSGVGVIQLGTDDHIVPAPSTSVEGALLNVFDTPVSDSVYLANQIFSAVTKAEEGGEREKINSRQELQRLANIYSNSPIDNSKTLRLIRQAMDLLESEGR